MISHSKQLWLWIALLTLLFQAIAVRAAPAAQKRQPRVIELQEIQVEGRLQKPNAFYILNRSRVRSTMQLQDQHFLRKSVDALREQPF